MLRLAIITAIHGRHRVVEAMLRHHVRLAAQVADCCELSVVAVMSPSDAAALFPVCDELGILRSAWQNNPVSRKWQGALTLARHMLNPDAVMVVGSDDFINEAYLRHAVARLKSGVQGCGPDSVWFYSIPGGPLGLWRGPMTIERSPEHSVALPAGAGRVLSRGLLDALEWQLWDFDRDTALDTHSSRRIIERTNSSMSIIRMDSVPGAAIVDCKNGCNIHAWSAIPYSHVVESAGARELLQQVGLGVCVEVGDAKHA